VWRPQAALSGTAWIKYVISSNMEMMSWTVTLFFFLPRASACFHSPEAFNSRSGKS
jgi:hypothetical protein